MPNLFILKKIERLLALSARKQHHYVKQEISGIPALWGRWTGRENFRIFFNPFLLDSTHSHEHETIMLFSIFSFLREKNVSTLYSKFCAQFAELRLRITQSTLRHEFHAHALLEFAVWNWRFLFLIIAWVIFRAHSFCPTHSIFEK